MPRKAILFLSVVFVALVVGSAALAQTSASYNLEWHVIGGGGQPAASANYVVNSTVGQGSASASYLSAEHYVIAGGFWTYAGVSRPYSTYLPLVMRNSP